MEYLIKTKSIGGLTEDEFFEFCQENDTLRLERNANGDIILMEPTGMYTSSQNAGITAKLYLWNETSGAGTVFDSNAGFTLPNKAVRSPDGAFLSNERWSRVPRADREKFGHICPDFVFELRSRTDSLDVLKSKMKEWMDNGCRLGWMIDPKKKETTIYRQNGCTEVKSFSTILSGEDVLSGFELDLTKIFTEQ